MRWRRRREQFRAILTGERTVVPASVYDPLSARVAEDIGFECGIFAGSVASLTVLGDPDHILLTLTEFVEQAHRICRAGGLPLLVDADHGYGNALNVKRTVEELENAGVCALSIEDTALPRPFGSGGRTSLVSVAEGVGKMRAALDARLDPALVIAGRTSAAGVSGTDDMIERITAYADVGVDAIFLVGLRDADQLRAAAEAVPLPLIIGSADPSVLDAALMQNCRVRIRLAGHKPIRAALGAVHAALAEMRDGVDSERVSQDELMKRSSRAAEYRKYIEDFLE